MDASEDPWVAAEDSEDDGGMLEEDGDIAEPEEEYGDLQLVNILSAASSQEPRCLSRCSLRFLDWWKGLSSSLPNVDGYSTLHQEILELCATIQFTDAEEEQRAKSIEKIKAVVKQVWPSAELVLFGSTASGLALPGSDIDLTIVPHLEERSGAGPGSNRQQPTTNEWLSALAYSMKRNKLCSSVQKIGRAKVPILKCVLYNGLAIDISFNVTNGPTVVPLVKELLAHFPALRPLCLVLKCFLGQRNLNEVYKGGIGSYCLLVMICAHLSEIYRWASKQRDEAARSTTPNAPTDDTLTGKKEDKAEQPLLSSAPPPTDADKQAQSADATATSEGTKDLNGTEDSDKVEGPVTAAKGEKAAQKEFRMEDDLGLLLLSFFARYGMLHDYVEDIVSICPGPAKSKVEMGWLNEKDPTLLAVEDPQVPGRDIGRNSYRIDVVKAEFNRALAILKINWSKPKNLNRILDLERDRWSLNLCFSPPADSLPSAAGKKRKKGGGSAEDDASALPLKKIAKVVEEAMKSKKKKNKKKKKAKQEAEKAAEKGELGTQKGAASGGPSGKEEPAAVGSGGSKQTGKKPQSGQGGGILGMAPPPGSRPPFAPAQRPFQRKGDFKQGPRGGEWDGPFPPPHNMRGGARPFHEGGPPPFRGQPPFGAGPGDRGGPERPPPPPFMMRPGPDGPLPRPPMGFAPFGQGPGPNNISDGGPREFDRPHEGLRPPRFETARFGPEGQWIGNVPWQSPGPLPHDPAPGSQMGGPPFGGMPPPPPGGANWPGAGGPAGSRSGPAPPPPLRNISTPDGASGAGMQQQAPANAGQGDSQESQMFILASADNPTVQLERVRGQTAAFARQIVLASRMGVPISRFTKKQWKDIRRNSPCGPHVKEPPHVATGRHGPLPSSMADAPRGPSTADGPGRSNNGMPGRASSGEGILGRAPANVLQQQQQQPPFAHSAPPDRLEPGHDDMMRQHMAPPPGLPFPPEEMQQPARMGNPLLGSTAVAGDPVSGLNMFSSGFGDPPMLSQFGRELEGKSRESVGLGGGSSLQPGLSAPPMPLSSWNSSGTFPLAGYNPQESALGTLPHGRPPIAGNVMLPGDLGRGVVGDLGTGPSFGALTNAGQLNGGPMGGGPRPEGPGYGGDMGYGYQVGQGGNPISGGMVPWT